MAGSKASVVGILIIYVLGCCVVVTNAVMCYECHNCKDTFDPEDTHYQKCRGSFCRKSKVVNGDLSQVYRQCTEQLDGFPLGCMVIKTEEGPEYHLCHCDDEDYCNGSTRILPLATGLLTIVTMATYALICTCTS